MSTHRTHTPFTVFIAAASLSCASVLSVAWPAVLHADDGRQEAAAENQNQVPPDAARFGDTAANIELETDEKTGKARVHLVAYNTSKKESFVKLDLCLERYEINPMARSGPPPEIAWEQTAKLVIPAGERFERTYQLPAKLAKDIIAAQKAEKEAAEPDEDAMPRTFTAYQASVQAPDPDRAKG